MINGIVNKLYIKLYGTKKYAQKLGVEIGSRGRFYINDWGSEPYLITIGDDVTITQGVRLLTHDGSAELAKNGSGERYYKYGKVNIGSRVFIGFNSIIMPGVTVGNDVIIGAGSIVTKDLDCGHVYAGVPAKKIDTIARYIEKTKDKGCIFSSLMGETKKDKITSIFEEG